MRVQIGITDLVIKRLNKGLLGGFAGVDELCSMAPVCRDQKNIALEASSDALSRTMVPGRAGSWRVDQAPGPINYR